MAEKRVSLPPLEPPRSRLPDEKASPNGPDRRSQSTEPSIPTRQRNSQTQPHESRSKSTEPILKPNQQVRYHERHIA
eukprot:scaffold672014_cov37-Prasinocladus_malaysianus.AAC.1